MGNIALKRLGGRVVLSPVALLIHDENSRLNLSTLNISLFTSGNYGQPRGHVVSGTSNARSTS